MMDLYVPRKTLDEMNFEELSKIKERLDREQIEQKEKHDEWELVFDDFELELEKLQKKYKVGVEADRDGDLYIESKCGSFRRGI